MSSARARKYADDEAGVGAGSDESEGEHCSVSSDESEESQDEYDMKDGFVVADDASDEDSANDSGSADESELPVRPVLPQDEKEQEDELAHALKSAESIRKRARESAETDARQAKAAAAARAVPYPSSSAAAAKDSPKPSATAAAPRPASFLRKPAAAAPSERSAAAAVQAATTSSPLPKKTQPQPKVATPKVQASAAAVPAAAAEAMDEAADSAAESAAASEPLAVSVAPPPKRAKTLDVAQIPPRPASLGPTLAPGASAASTKSKRAKPFLFRVEFTDGVSARKFLDVVASAVTEMRFHIIAEKGFTGLRLEAHDANWHTAIRSQLECSVKAGSTPEGGPATLQSLHETSFTVSAGRFMTALDCALLKDTTLSLTRYHSTVKEEITFEAITNEDDVRTAYAAPLIASPDTQLGNISHVAVELGFHVNVNIDVLAKLCSIAKKCAAATMDFEVFQAVDAHDPAVLHSRMHIGFGEFGGHDFFLTSRRSGTDWVPVTGPTEAEREDIVYVRKSSNSYDAAKLRLFVGKLATEWVLVHLSNSNATKPLVLEASMGSGKSQHAIMVAPREQ
jgi:hypothetical protein